ncbi:hypothetical protein N7471_013714 [Penicillium samsonianum]|uniref:uncharacterized protein n=1 Tax=Penicillium samsonianum TaxID=1882272 RepID=UPI0025469D96|nr:uncharacterized protein N7471_013714 [Penicillium samsonianum]KAJ6118247.1 hypothetical protein N7471_013714 [Penicillium samsonianum]
MSVLLRSLRFAIFKKVPTIKAIPTRFSTFANTTGKIPVTTSQSESSTEPCSKSVKWKEVNNGQYIRPFDSFEQMFSFFCHDPARPESRSLDIVASVGMETLNNDANTNLETIKKAWIRLRYLHPTLATEVGQKEFRYMPLKSQADIDNWLAKTFIVKEWDSHTEVQGCQDLGIAPAAQSPVLYYFPGKQKLILRMDHMHGDGQAVVNLLQDLFTEIQRLNSGGKTVNEPWGAEVHNLASGAFDAAGITALEDSWSSNLISSLPQPQADGEAFEIPSIYNKHPPGAGKTQSLEFSENETSELLDQAKKMNLGITAFLHAALLHAGKRISPSSDSMVHSTVLTFSFRERCTDSPPNANSRAAALRIGFWPIQVPMSDEFQRTALRIKNGYEALAHRKSAALITMVPYLQKSASVLSQEYFKGILPSFIGNISKAFPKTYGSFKIRDFWMAAVPTDERIYLGIQTFGNRLSIRACYNQTYHTDEQIANYLLHVRKEMYAGLASNVEKFNFLSM